MTNSPVARPNSSHRDGLHEPADDMILGQMCLLSTICVEFQETVFGEDHLSPEEQVHVIGAAHQRLQDWYEDTSPRLEGGASPALGATHVRLSYHLALMTLFGFSGIPRNSALPKSHIDHANAMCLMSARAIATLSATECHDIRTIPPFLLFANQFALLVLLTNLNNSDDSAAFVKCCQVLERLAQSWKLARMVLRMAGMTGRYLSARIPATAKAILDRYETEDCSSGSSGLPNYALVLMGASTRDSMEGLSDRMQRWTLMEQR